MKEMVSLNPNNLNASQTFRVWQLDRFGGTDVLHSATRNLVPLKSGEMRVRVKAVGMNHLDLWVRKGLPHIKVELPHLLGSEACVEVVEVADAGLQSWLGSRALLQPGHGCGECEFCLAGDQHQCREYHIRGENTSGAYAQYLVVTPQQLVAIPNSGWSDAEWASIPLVFLTAYEMLYPKARLQHGEVVLVQAAGSGIGSAAIQLARQAGCTVIATGRGESKQKWAAQMGAQHFIDYEKQSVLSEVKKITNRRGVDVVVEHVGKSTWDDSLNSLRWGGRLVTCGATTGNQISLDLTKVFFKQLAILGSTMGRP